MGAADNPLIFLSAGEASGERYGAALMEAIRRRVPGARFFGLGGAAMAAQGFRPVVRAEDVAHMGITEVVRHAPYIYGQFQRLKRAIAAERPALAVLIDFPDVNLRLAEHLHRYRNTGGVLCLAAAVGVEEAAHPAGAALCGPHAGDLSL